MPFYAVWIDREKARVFQFSDEKMERVVLEATHQDHHTHQLDHEELESKKFYGEVAEQLGKDGRILVVGPGVIKEHFCSFLTKRFAQISARVVGCETVDHPTDHQIAAIALKYFTTGSPGRKTYGPRSAM